MVPPPAPTYTNPPQPEHSHSPIFMKIQVVDDSRVVLAAHFHIMRVLLLSDCSKNGERETIFSGATQLLLLELFVRVPFFVCYLLLISLPCIRNHLLNYLEDVTTDEFNCSSVGSLLAPFCLTCFEKNIIKKSRNCR